MNLNDIKRKYLFVIKCFQYRRYLNSRWKWLFSPCHNENTVSLSLVSHTSEFSSKFAASAKSRISVKLKPFLVSVLKQTIQIELLN